MTRAAAWVAALLGLASAAVSVYWAFGGSALLGTVGGSVERWGRERGATVVLALIGIAVLKAVVAVAAPILTGTIDLPAWTHGRAPRLLGWIAAGVLVIYGGVLTAAGLLVEADIIDPGADADRHALAWHAWFWDPWFLLWGLAFAVALWRTRPSGAVSRSVSTSER